MVRLPFRDRREAGRAVAEQLHRYAMRSDALVLGLPRGGVPVAYEVSQALRAPLDVLVVRKLGVPGHEELAMGAIAAGGAQVLNEPIIQRLNVSHHSIDAAVARQKEELSRRERRYRGGRPPPRMHGRCVILVDDGLATGASMAAAIEAVRQQGAARVVVAVPVAPLDTCQRLRRLADEVVAVATPAAFAGVGQWYLDFEPTPDEQVHELLARTAPGTGQVDPINPVRRSSS